MMFGSQFEKEISQQMGSANRGVVKDNNGAVPRTSSFANKYSEKDKQDGCLLSPMGCLLTI